jgi:hypothetical protein
LRLRQTLMKNLSEILGAKPPYGGRSGASP